MKDLISVIIPVYKVEKYIQRCVDSVINQTYKNLEIVLVDDGSPDNCPTICDEYAKKDKRIKSIHKKNGGLSDARNVGIEKCKGKYITFIDSDDYVSNDYVEVLYNVLKKYDVRVSVADNYIVYEEGKTINNSNNVEYLVSPEQFFEKMLWGERDLDNGAWTKLYDRNLFKKVKYPVGKLYEDTATTYKIIDQCKNVAIISKPIYYYMKRKDSITQCAFNENKLQLIDSTNEMTNYVEKKYPNLSIACKRKRLWAYFSTLSQLVASKNDNEFKDIRINLVDYIKHNSSDVFFDRRTPKRDKMGIMCLKFGYKFYKFSWRTYLKLTKKY